MNRPYGAIKRNENGLSGRISGRLYEGNVTLKNNEKKNSEAAPDFVVLENGRHVIGAAWEKTSAAGKCFMSITLDLEEQDKPIYLHAFQQDNDNSAFDVVWTRPRGGNKALQEGNTAPQPAQNGAVDDEIPF